MNLTQQAKTLAIMASLLVATSVHAASNKGTTAEQGWWKWNDGGTPTYSDIPNNMRPGSATWYNTRGRVVTVTDPKPQQQDLSTMSLADQQRVINERIAKQNEEAEKKNKEVEEENRKLAEENCKRAQMNRQNAENARVANKEELIARYSQDVAKFCR